MGEDVAGLARIPFWHHAAGATAVRVLLAAAGLDTFLEGRIEVYARTSLLTSPDCVDINSQRQQKDGFRMCVIV